MLDVSVDPLVCPLNLASTASTAMAIGDALAVAWMERRGVSPEALAPDRLSHRRWHRGLLVGVAGGSSPHQRPDHRWGSAPRPSEPGSTHLEFAYGHRSDDRGSIKVNDEIVAIKAIERMEQNHRKAISVLPVVDGENLMLGLLRLHDLVRAGLATTAAD